MIVKNGDRVIVEHSGLCYEEDDFEFVVGSRGILKGINDAVLGKELDVEYTVHIPSDKLWGGWYAENGVQYGGLYQDVSLDLTIKVIKIN